MSSAIRQQLLTKLAELSELTPEYRFGQMICNLAHSVRDSGPSAHGTSRILSCSRRLSNISKIAEGSATPS